MPGDGGVARGLSAAELGAVVGELQALLGSTVAEVSALRTPLAEDDLLIVLRRADGGEKTFLHMAPGGARARITTTSTRFDATAFVRTPASQAVDRELAGARLCCVRQTPDERRCALLFSTTHGDRELVVELFGARGLWALLDGERRTLAMPREVTTAVRTLRLGDRYSAPPPAPPAAGESAPRFSAPVLVAVDEHFSALDRAASVERERETLLHAAKRALAKSAAKVAGLARQLDDAERPARLRAQADLMLAFAHAVPRGARSMTVTDPETGAPRTFDLDPSRSVVVQARALYDQARRLDDGRAVAERRHAEAVATNAELERIVADLELEPESERVGLVGLRAALQRVGAIAAPRPQESRRPGTRDRAENFRRFVSAEGYPILVGRDNEQNDRLTMRVANGNDVWLHVGGGRPGSHVIVRLPKQKTASLETLLDAAMLAVHFSKARGEPRVEVVYTLRKHVRKPKGSPPGSVLPAQTKTIVSLADDRRLHRLLTTAAEPGL